MTDKIAIEAIAADVARRLAEEWDNLGIFVTAESEGRKLLCYTLQAFEILLNRPRNVDNIDQADLALAFGAVWAGWSMAAEVPTCSRECVRDYEAGYMMRILFDEYRACLHSRPPVPSEDDAASPGAATEGREVGRG